MAESEQPGPSRARLHRTTASPPAGLLTRLGVYGMRALEPVVLAALATESPLLFIGPHGTAKSYLLERLSAALGLTWRHYNASLLNFDDLVGFPVPDDRGGLRYLRTPASVWDAQVVFLDEISRCRPDMQNRLFPLIHERRVQGVALDRLVHRWAAMNPPPPEEAGGDDEIYEGSTALDPALADRFPFVVPVPTWESFGRRDRDALIGTGPAPVDPTAAAALGEALEQVRRRIPVITSAYGPGCVEYVRLVSDRCRQMGLRLSGRRAGMLYRNIVAVHAAQSVLRPGAELEATAWLALEHSLPHRAQGVRVDRPRLLIAHHEIWQTIHTDAADPRRMLVAEPDPVRRAIIAAGTPSLSAAELSAYIADGLAEAPIGGRHALAEFIMRSPALPRLNAAVAEQVAELYRLVAMAQDIKQTVAVSSAPSKTWDAIVLVLARQPERDDESRAIANLLCGLFAKGDLATGADVEAAHGSWTSVRVWTAPGGEGREAAP
jgi:MoxR-like ATPase